MSTTTLFVELLIIGFEYLIALVLWLSLVAGSIGWLTGIGASFEHYSFLATALVFSIAYFLGIVFDKFSKWLFEDSLLGTRIQEWLIRKTMEINEIQRMYAKVMVDKGEPMSDLLYSRSKVRIFRASIVGIPTIAIAAVLLFLQSPNRHLWWLPIIIGAVLTVLTVFGYTYNQRLYWRRLELFFYAASR